MTFISLWFKHAAHGKHFSKCSQQRVKVDLCDREIPLSHVKLFLKTSNTLCYMLLFKRQDITYHDLGDAGINRISVQFALRVDFHV